VVGSAAWLKSVVALLQVFDELDSHGVVGVLGNGRTVNLSTLFGELDALEARGLDPGVYVAGRHLAERDRAGANVLFEGG
jgi:hypothetical protein